MLDLIHLPSCLLLHPALPDGALHEDELFPWHGSALPSQDGFGVKHCPWQLQPFKGWMALPVCTPAASAGWLVLTHVVLGFFVLHRPLYHQVPLALTEQVLVEGELCAGEQAALLPGPPQALQALHGAAEPAEVHGAQLANMMHKDGKSR